MLKILLVEPHGDDSLCSCSSVLRSNCSVDILTLASRDSGKLSDHYQSVNNTVYYDFEDLLFSDRPKVSTHDIHRRYVEGEDVYKYYYQLVLDKFGTKYLEAVERVASIIKGVLSSNIYDIILYPVGLNHPYHIAVSEGVKQCLNSLGRGTGLLGVEYVDKPYIANRYVKEMYESYKRGINPRDIIQSMKVDKSEEVEKVLKDVYPTEVVMLRFYSEILLEGQDTFLVNNDSEIVYKFMEVLK